MLVAIDLISFFFNKIDKSMRERILKPIATSKESFKKQYNYDKNIPIIDSNNNFT